MLLANSIASTLIEPIGTDLQSIFAGGLEEDAGEELGAGLHLEPLLDLFTLAGEAGKRCQDFILPRKVILLFMRMEYLCIHTQMEYLHWG